MKRITKDPNRKRPLKISPSQNFETDPCGRNSYVTIFTLRYDQRLQGFQSGKAVLQKTVTKNSLYVDLRLNGRTMWYGSAWWLGVMARRFSVEETLRNSSFWSYYFILYLLILYILYLLSDFKTILSAKRSFITFLE